MAEPVRSFTDLGLPPALLAALTSVGYETPTPIQARTVPPLLAGRDVLGHAPTGTGKTAAFALPILARLDVDKRDVQALVLTPTRELAIQVAEAFARYASSMPRLGVLPIYGGQDYAVQLKALSRGVHVVVGTPGRVSDHLRRGTLALGKVSTLVLDEADEMLRMGFVDDVEWILDKTPQSRQTALFSATMPPQIKRIARRHLKNPEEIGIEGRRSAATTIRQRVWIVGGMNKLEALTRLLEVERFDAMLVFVRTKSSTVELAEKLEARGFAAQAMNGDMPQKERERQVDKLKSGALDILVATDVVARGLDVERISHVINFDIPYDTEAYVHRIGRTGRAGRSGEAILFAAPRERRLLGAIEKATGQKIENLQLPTVHMVNERRVEVFESRITETLQSANLDFLEDLVNRYAAESTLPMSRVAAALAHLAIGDRPLLLDDSRSNKRHAREDKADRSPRDRDSASAGKASRDAPQGRQRPTRQEAPQNTQRPARRDAPANAATEVSRNTAGVIAKETARKSVRSKPRETTGETASDPTSDPTERDSNDAETTQTPPPGQPAHAPRAAVHDIVMERFRVEVGTDHGAEIANIVGAIANEADIRAEYIGRVDMQGDHSIIELPEGMPKFMLKELRRVWVAGRQLGLSRLSAGNSSRAAGGDRADTSSSVRTPSGSAGKSARKPSSSAGTKRPENTRSSSGKPSSKGKDKGIGKGKSRTHRKGTSRSDS